jgi:hypothetical protein
MVADMSLISGRWVVSRGRCASRFAIAVREGALRNSRLPRSQSALAIPAYTRVRRPHHDPFGGLRLSDVH